MTKPIGLPEALRARLTALTRRIRWLRAVRGLCVLTLLGIVLLGGLFIADGLLTLTPDALRYALLGITAALGLAALGGLVLPLFRRHDPEALAALIEQRYPELGERLTTAVELAGNRDTWHGSHALIELLIEDTERRTHTLDIPRAFPARATCRLALFALAALLFAFAPALFWGDRYADFGNRLLAAWSEPVPEVSPSYTFTVHPGQGYAAKGRPLTLLTLVHADAHRALPPAAAATLVYTDARHNLVRVRMTAEPALLPALAAGCVTQAAAPLGSLPLPVTAKLLTGVGPKTRAFMYRFDRLTADYLPFHIEAGRWQSGLFEIRAVEPVELRPESPQITVAAPPYADPAVHPKQQIPPLTADVSAFEFGDVRLHFGFTRPAVAARLELSRQTKDSRAGETWTLPLELKGERTEAYFVVPSLRPGAYDLRLVLDAEHGITTVNELRTLTVRADEPPVFTTRPDIAGLKPAEARADWQVGADPTGGRFRAVRGGFNLAQAREVAPTDTVKFKVAAEDTIGVERVELEYRINDGPAAFETVAAGKGRLKAEPPQGEYGFKLAGKVKDGDVVFFRVKASDNRRLARGQLRDADGRPDPRAELRPHVTYYPERLKGKDRWFILRVSRTAPPLARQEILAQRDQVRGKIDAVLKKLNAERTQLNKLRTEVRTRPELSPEQKSGLRDLRRDNREVRGDLQQLARDTHETPALQPITETAEQLARDEMSRSEQALTKAHDPKKDGNAREQQLQRADAELARAQKRLDELRKQNEKLAQARLDQLKLEQLAQRQEELGKRAAEVADKNPQDPQARAELDRLRAEQNEVADELSRLADQSETLREALKAAQAEQAKQLAQQAKELAQAQRDLNDAAKETTAKEAEAKFGELARKQQDLARKAAELARATARPAKAANKQPLRPDDAQKAAEALKQGDVPDAVQKQTQAMNELDRLARDFDTAIKRLPTAEQRKQQALAQLGDIRRQQREVARQAEQVLKQNEKKNPADPKERTRLARALTDAARQQAQLAERLSKLDVPYQGGRQEKAERAMNEALKDLLDGQAQDVPASQQQAKHSLDRLEKALRGEQTPDEKARELARKQKELSEEARRLAREKATPQQVKQLQDRQQALAAQAQALPAREEAPLQAERAAKATKQAADAAKAQPTQPATRQKMEQAAQALEKLADQLAGKETDADRAERLAREQAKLAAEARQQAKKEPGKVNGPEVAQRQQQIGDEAKQVRGGEEAQAEKKQALEALAKAQQPGQRPEQKAQAQQAAADALRDLADKMAGRTDPAAKAAELARQQHDLAKEAAEAAKKDPRPLRPEQHAEQMAELTRKAAQKQADLARQAQRLNAPKAAEQAQKRAAQQMAAAQKALEQAKTPGAAKEALAKAADAADKLAKELARHQAAHPAAPKGGEHTAARMGAQVPKQLAQKLAQEQRQLAQATQRAQQQAQGKPGPQGNQALQQALAKVAERQTQLNQKAGHLDAHQAQTGLRKARQAMNQAQEALQKNNAAEARQKQQEAAQALEQLARKLADKAPAQAAAPQPDAAPAGLPTKAQADQARQLAKAQKELRDAVQKLAAQAPLTRKTQPGDENPLGELARKQRDIARQAADLAKVVAGEQGVKAPITQQAQQAAQQAQQAAQKANAGQAAQAQKAGQQLAQDLHKLAQNIYQTPRGNADPRAPDPARRATQLAQQQDELNRKMQALAGDAAAQKAQQVARQGELQKQTGELMKQFGKLGQEAAQGPAKQAAQQAAQATNQAQQAMQQAQNQAKQGNTGKAGQAGQQAAQHLDRAAQASQQMQAGQKPGQSQTAKEAGQALQQGKDQVGQAQAKLGQGQPKQAQGAMKQAAQSLQQAAAKAGQQLVQPKESGPPNQFAKESGPKGAAPVGLPDLSAFGKELKQYAGRSWGELPGELRTRITQAMQARYGEDYAGIIQRYFEQIADTNRAKQRP
jgi:hypothetical protein